ncbi:hypothetical protein BH20CHL6_BH20CHL6_20900 [soil metagenome]
MIEAPASMNGSASRRSQNGAVTFVRSVARTRRVPAPPAGGMLLILEVALHRDRATAFRLDELHRAPGILALFEVRNEDIGAFAREGDGDGLADAAVTARDDGHETRQAPFPM